MASMIRPARHAARGLAAALTLVTLTTGPALAQSSLPELDRRVTTLERDMRAVRRLVLPGGRVVEPEVDTGAPAAVPPPAPGTAPPLAALTERVDSLERQQRRLTAQLEEQDFKLRQLERQLAELRAAQSRLETAIAAPAADGAPGMGASAATLPPAAPQVGAGSAQPPAASAPGRGTASATAPGSTAATGTVRPPATTSPAAPPGTGSAQASRPPAAPAPARPDAQFSAALALVRASDWPAAETAMAAFARAHPRHPQASLARYWAGRAQHNQGKFETAARTHFDNYQADQRGSHAQHSLYWVGQALVRLNRAPEACQVYTLAGRVYADEMLPELRPQFAQARRTAGCQG